MQFSCAYFKPDLTVHFTTNFTTNFTTYDTYAYSTRFAGRHLRPGQDLQPTNTRKRSLRGPPRRGKRRRLAYRHSRTLKLYTKPLNLNPKPEAVIHEPSDTKPGNPEPYSRPCAHRRNGEHNVQCRLRPAGDIGTLVHVWPN